MKPPVLISVVSRSPLCGWNIAPRIINPHRNMSTKSPECWASDPNARGLRIEVSPERSLLLPHGQFIFAELTSGGDEQNLKLVFATHEVSVRGHHLRRIETTMQRGELSLLAKLPSSQRNLITEGQPVIFEIVVTEMKQLERSPSGESNDRVMARAVSQKS